MNGNCLAHKYYSAGTFKSIVCCTVWLLFENKALNCGSSPLPQLSQEVRGGQVSETVNKERQQGY